jgi:hypothetical protein
MEYGEPTSYLTLQPGVDVISADGDRIGALEHVLADEETSIFDGIIIDIRTGPGGLRFVDAPEVAECHEKAVLITIATADVDSLPEPSANPAVIENHGVEDVPGLNDKLRRAWDRISGQ